MMRSQQRRIVTVALLAVGLASVTASTAVVAKRGVRAEGDSTILLLSPAMTCTGTDCPAQTQNSCPVFGDNEYTNTNGDPFGDLTERLTWGKQFTYDAAFTSECYTPGGCSNFADPGAGQNPIEWCFRDAKHVTAGTWIPQQAHIFSGLDVNTPTYTGTPLSHMIIAAFSDAPGGHGPGEHVYGGLGVSNLDTLDGLTNNAYAEGCFWKRGTVPIPSGQPNAGKYPLQRIPQNQLNTTNCGAGAQACIRVCGYQATTIKLEQLDDPLFEGLTTCSDGDGSGIVDIGDFNYVSNHFGNSYPLGAGKGDYNWDGVVDLDDFRLWKDTHEPHSTVTCSVAGSEAAPCNVAPKTGEICSPDLKCKAKCRR